jgi:hypothetical protein
MPGDVKQELAEVAEAVPQIPLPRPGREDAGTAVAARKPSSSWERLTALILKEFLQIWRDRRTLGLIIPIRTGEPDGHLRLRRNL